MTMLKKIKSLLPTLVAVSAVLLLPDLAGAEEPWEKSAKGLTTSLQSFAVPASVLVIIITGLLAWTGKMQWATVGKVVGGFVFIFGAVQISTFLQGIVA